MYFQILEPNKWRFFYETSWKEWARNIWWYLDQRRAVRGGVHVFTGRYDRNFPLASWGGARIGKLYSRVFRIEYARPTRRILVVFKDIKFIFSFSDFQRSVLQQMKLSPSQLLLNCFYEGIRASLSVPPGQPLQKCIFYPNLEKWEKLHKWQEVIMH